MAPAANDSQSGLVTVVQNFFLFFFSSSDQQFRLVLPSCRSPPQSVLLLVYTFKQQTKDQLRPSNGNNYVFLHFFLLVGTFQTTSACDPFPND